MRGKLRDKHTATKRDTFKREVIERKRTNKRDMRPTTWLEQQRREQDEELELNGASNEETLITIPETK